MQNLAQRFVQNPLISPKDVKASDPDFEVICLLNPGVFIIKHTIYLVVRVAERPLQKAGIISFSTLKSDNSVEVIEINLNDPTLNVHDPRVITYKGLDYLTTLSHLRLFKSDDGVSFYDTGTKLTGIGEYETFGIEDCRVCQIDGTYYLTYTAVSSSGVGIALRTTKNWIDFKHHQLILPPHNKDCTFFDEKIDHQFYCLHRPSSPAIGGNYIWLANSPDSLHWGNHRCILKTRSGYWDSARVGAGASPIKTDEGWLVIYHGADDSHRYSLGAALLSLSDPSVVLARSENPIMEPIADYEVKGFFGQVVFTNGHYLHPDGDTLTIYYGAADEFICGARFSVRDILASLKK